jgi:hypothetical protein
MPNLDALLNTTMCFRGTRARNQEPVPLSRGVFFSREPKPQTMAEVRAWEREETALANPIWRLRWDSENPGTFRDVSIKSRGMGMDYSMDVSVLRKVEFRSVKVTRATGAVLDLYLSDEFMLGAWRSYVGEIPAGGSGLWRLEAKLDVSVVVAFGFEVSDDGRVIPLNADLDDELMMPPAGDPPRLRFRAGDVASSYVCVGPSRYVVVVELVLCKERSDFVPGNIVGFARIHPHAFLWSNEDLTSAEVRIVLQRPPKSMACNEPAMKDDIGLLVVADTNDVHSLSAWAGLPIPYTDNLYDYYATDPHKLFRYRARHEADHPAQDVGEVTLADTRFTTEREIENAVVRNTPLVANDRTIRKCRRQGQFDNVHMAARMMAKFTCYEDGSTPKEVTLDDIVMINQCIHDCVHMHVRWGEFLTDPIMCGWGPAGPHSRPGVPGVPPNQTVFVSFPNDHGIVYRALAEGVKAGAEQVFCHHGAAYAVDLWPTVSAFGMMEALHAGVRAEAIATQDAHAKEIPAGWLEFYWRVRWIGEAASSRERLTFQLERCMR